MAPHWKPDDMSTISPALPGGARLIEFMKKVFDAKLKSTYPMGDLIAHAEIQVGECIVMTGDPMGEHSLLPAAVSIYVPDCDATYKRALDAGATSKEEPSNQFWGDRSARIVDPFGNTWSIATRVEEVSEEEIYKRMAAMGQ